MKKNTSRPMNASESLLVKDALLNAPLQEIPESLLKQIDSLDVVGECECGCGSIYFRSIEKGDYRLADGVGYLPDGGKVGVILWSNAQGKISALEIDYHEGTKILPASVCSWEEAGKREAAK